MGKSLKDGRRRVTVDFDTAVFEKVSAAGKSEERDFSAQLRYIVNQWVSKQDKKSIAHARKNEISSAPSEGKTS